MNILSSSRRSCRRPNAFAARDCGAILGSTIRGALRALAGALVCLAYSQAQRVPWEEKAPYADRILYNGQRYKTIQIEDKINVWASMNHTKDVTVANVVITNEGKGRFDIDPEKFVCICTSPRQRVLKYNWFFNLEKSTGLMVLRANSVPAGADLKGLVSFERIRKCETMKLIVTVQEVAFEFPFTHAGGSTTGNMN